jgi:hypothetical protein
MIGQMAGALQPPTVLPPLPAMVTAPSTAFSPAPVNARPKRLAPAPIVTLALAMSVPQKLVPLSVADEPTRQ